jgi:hypothetical protein
MLQQMLHAHRRIAVPPPTGFVLAAYENRRSFGDLSDPARREALGRWITDRPETGFTSLGLEPQAIIQRLQAGPATLGAALATIFQAYADRLGKPRWGDQRPEYLQHLDVILRLFPNAQIVNIVRDGRDCVASLKELSWHQRGLHATVAAWARSVDDARRAARQLPRDQWHQLRYEELIADAPGTLIRLCSFLGESYDPAMAFPVKPARMAAPAHRAWQHRTHEPVSTWQRRLTGKEIALCEAVLGSRLVMCGYELSGAVRPRRTDWLRYSLTAAPHRLAPARQGLTRAAVRLRPEPELAGPTR